MWHRCHDANTGQSFEHRRQWIEDKLLDISQLFAIDICAYAIMSNHYHVVLYIDKEQADNWNRDDVIKQWHHLFSGNLISRRYANNESLSKAN